MKKSKRQLNQELRERYIRIVKDALVANGEDVQRVSNGALAFPVVDANQNEKWVELGFKIPTGSRDGDAYDGYELAAEWVFQQERL